MKNAVIFKCEPVLAIKSIKPDTKFTVEELLNVLDKKYNWLIIKHQRKQFQHPWKILRTKSGLNSFIGRPRHRFTKNLLGLYFVKILLTLKTYVQLLFWPTPDLGNHLLLIQMALREEWEVSSRNKSVNLCQKLKGTIVLPEKSYSQ